MIKHLISLLILVLVLKLSSCAKISSPKGGPKDTIPPVIAFVKPQHLSTNFNSNKITIKFDEFIKLNNIGSQFIISPPLDKKPIIKPESGVSKKITIDFLEPLKPNTTYTLNFGNSILDNNESNELGKLTYVFSTGNYIDSLRISGRVYDPFAKDSVQNISLYAYKNKLDSLISKNQPNYITNTQKTDSYELENLSKATYKVIAIDDKNHNYQYDIGLEKIGFIAQPISLTKNKKSVNFTLFTEPIPHKIQNPIQITGQQIIIGYTGQQPPNIDVTGIDKKEYLLTKKTAQDSVYLWLKNEVKDSITITSKLDTIVKKHTILPRILKKDSITVKSLINKVLHPKDSLILETNNPINTIVKDSIVLLENDSLLVDFDVINQQHNHKIYINFKRKFKTNYSLIIKDSAFIDFLKQESRNIKKKNFKTLDSEDYGAFKLFIKKPDSLNLVIQLIRADKQNKNYKIATNKKEVVFNKIEANEYFVRITKDTNNNNKYDTGNFKQQIQPEEVLYLKNKSKFNIRANSEIIEKLIIE